MSKNKGVSLPLLLILLLVLISPLLGKKPTLNFFVSSGMSFPSYPESLSNLYPSAVNVGLGMETQLWSRFALGLNFNYYSYPLKDGDVKMALFGTQLYELPVNEPWHVEGSYSGYDFWADLKYLFF